MFYSQLILAKKGPLGTIWIAAHLERKLRKNQVTETNISVSVDSILFPEAPIALRLSGHLLLGVVRIYSRKVNYLFHDCSEALTKIKQAFHSGVVDLPPESATAPFHAITLPENFDLDELEPLPDRESAILLSNGAADHHVTTRELITLQDPMEDNIYFGSQFGLDERFPEADMPRMALDFEEEEMEKEAREREQSPKLTLEEEVSPVEEDRIDFDRMDQMDAMDMDHMPPMTPAPHTMMDLDEQMIDQPLEHLEQPEEFEQLPPGEEEPEQLAPMLEEQEGLDPDINELQQMDRLPITREPDQPTTDVSSEALEESRTLMGVEDQEAVVQEPIDDVALVAVPDELVPVIEAAADQAKLSSVLPEFDQEDVPEVETLRSAVDPPIDQGPDLFAFEKEAAMAHENMASSDVDHQMEDKEQLVQDNDKMQEVREDSDVPIPGLTSPRRRPSFMEDDLPADDDVLATLLGGRSTPALRVMPTPSEEAPTQKFKRALKPPPRKRKPVLDVAMVLHGDVMREQLANTVDIRRVRKKAPCTQRELWAVQRQSLGHQIFSEPSLTGVCNALRELYDRMLVTGAADLPISDPQQDIRSEITPEKLPPSPQAEVPFEEPLMDEQRAQEAQQDEVQQGTTEQAAETIEGSAANLPMAPDTDAAVPSEVETSYQPAHGLEEAQDLNQVPEELGTDDLNKESVAPELPAIEGVDIQASMAMDETMDSLSTESMDKENAVDFPVLETEPEIASEPLLVSSTAAAVEPILLDETEVEVDHALREGDVLQNEIPAELIVDRVVDSVRLLEEEVQVTEVAGPANDEGGLLIVEQPELLEQAAVEAEAAVRADVVAESVAEGDAIVELTKDGQMIIVLEDDGGVIDGPFPVFEVKEEVVEEEVNQAELGFLGEPRETVFLDQDDDDLHEEAESYDDSTMDPTLQGLGGWSARTRAVGGYLQGVFENMNADTSRRDKDSVPKIGLDHTLRGKSRKEAARMFFETLSQNELPETPMISQMVLDRSFHEEELATQVLKTKDYVHVEQEQPFSEIYLSSRPKLMKASF